MSLNIDINFDEKSNIWDVKLSGEVDLYSANELKEELNIAIEEHKEDLKIDLQNLDYIDSTGLGILIGVLKRLQQAQKDIYIVNSKQNVRKIFTITGLDKIFKVEG